MFNPLVCTRLQRHLLKVDKGIGGENGIIAASAGPGRFSPSVYPHPRYELSAVNGAGGGSYRADFSIGAVLCDVLRFIPGSLSATPIKIIKIMTLYYTYNKLPLSYAAMACSKSSSGPTPPHNGMGERVIRALKETRQHASRIIADRIQFYNHRRPHQTLKMRTPAEVFALAA